MKRNQTFHPELELLETRALPATLLDVASAITHSNEAEANEIASYYTNLLQRVPSATEVYGWMEQLNQGVTTSEQIQTSFASSPEFLADHGGESPAWIQSLYQDFLGRTPGPAELNAWQGQIAQGATPQAIAGAFTQGVEHLSDRVTADYQTFLGRTPSPAEVSGWVAQMQAGLTDQNLDANFVASPEFFDGVSQGNLTEWLNNAYVTVLKRPAGPAEIDAWIKYFAQTANVSGPNSPTGNVDNSNSNSNYDVNNYVDTTDYTTDDSGYVDTSSYVDNSGSTDTSDSGSVDTSDSGSDYDCGC